MLFGANDAASPPKGKTTVYLYERTALTMQFYAPQHLAMQTGMLFSHSDSVMVNSHMPYDNGRSGHKLI